MDQFILKDARQNHYAAGAFNVNTYDEMVALADEAQRRNQPLMLMASMSSAQFFGPRIYAGIVRVLNENYSVPILSHLDHCTKPELLLECVEAGFDSVMYDGSHLPFEENVANTARLAAECRAKGVYIEGELGVIQGDEGPVKSAYSEFTDPAAAEEFVERSGVDSLAVSIGNAHGFYKGKPEIRFEILEEIAKRCALPLVLHGGTGIPQSDIERAIRTGIAKVNVGTELRAGYVRALQAYAAQHQEDADVRPFVSYLRAQLSETAGKYMQAFDPEHYCQPV